MVAEICSAFHQELVVENQSGKSARPHREWRDESGGIGSDRECQEEWAMGCRYDSPSGATVPDDFQAALDANPRAKTFVETLDRANRYAVLWRIQNVKKAETRARKIREFIGMLERNERIHP